MTTDEEVKRAKTHSVYGALQERTIENILIKKLIEGYGYSDKIEIAKRLVQDFLETINDYNPPASSVGHGQLVWYARAKDEKGGANRTAKDYRNVRTVLSLISKEEIPQLGSGSVMRRLQQTRAVRLIQEAFSQGAVLSQPDLAAIMLIEKSNVGKKLRAYQKETGKVIPTTGNVLDIGPAITHKERTIELYLKGYNELQISRMINHDLASVERYIGAMKRVELIMDKESPEVIGLILQMSPSLVQAYIDLLKKYHPKYRKGGGN